MMSIKIRDLWLIAISTAVTSTVGYFVGAWSFETMTACVYFCPVTALSATIHAKFVNPQS
jgi:hypothetical protein